MGESVRACARTDAELGCSDRTGMPVVRQCRIRFSTDDVPTTVKEIERGKTWPP